MPPKITLYTHPLSGHGHRITLALSLLGLAFESVTVDLRAGAHKQPDFLALNPFGQVPVLDDDGTVIADSNAILAYLAAKYDDGTLMPRDPVGIAQVQRWFSVAAGEIKYGPGAARLVKVFGAPLDHAACLQTAAQILSLLDAHLAERAYLVSDHLTFADVAIYSYVARAPEGEVDLASYAHVRNWLARIEAHPRFAPFVHAADILG
ncbi:MAG: glutathione S-transferase family protein [Thalassobaculaceae bacterium]|nr:glutathione S-transferase family protein [Thalassobaculaceae bacterium]